MLPLLDYKELDDDEKIFGESYDSEEDQSQISEHPNSEILEQQYGSEDESQ